VLETFVKFVGMYKNRTIGVITSIVLVFIYFKYLKPFVFGNPLEILKITSKFGATNGRTSPHNGTDFGAPIGTPIFAPQSGTVLKTWFDSKGGYQMQIQHNADYITGYAHLSKYNVSKGQKVKKGQQIALVGNTGTSTGPHLHFTVKYKGQNIDPMTVLKA
jgi:murein DD-endopeptidase MepM/ murein hydrolase activator NlpD